MSSAGLARPMSGLRYRSLAERKARLRQADQAVAALIVAYGADGFLKAITAALNDYQQLLHGQERQAGRSLATAERSGL